MSKIQKTILKVAVNTPLRFLMDYYAPEDICSQRIVPGMRVLVPLRNQKTVGVILATHAQAAIASERIKTAFAILDSQPILSKDILYLIHWASDYYHYPIGEVMQATLPQYLRQNKPATIDKPLIYLANNIDINLLKRAPKQLQAYQMIQANPQGITAKALTEQHISHVIVKQLIDKQFVKTAFQTAEKKPFTLGAKPKLTTYQAQAIKQILATPNQFNTFLLA
ncbi:MAG: hypothetical protein AAGG80_07800, partial [Pseudomonadota bacterium]